MYESALMRKAVWCPFLVAWFVYSPHIHPFYDPRKDLSLDSSLPLPLSLHALDLVGYSLLSVNVFPHARHPHPHILLHSPSYVTNHTSCFEASYISEQQCWDPLLQDEQCTVLELQQLRSKLVLNF